MGGDGFDVVVGIGVAVYVEAAIVVVVVEDYIDEVENLVVVICVGSVYTGSHVADSVVFVVFFHVCVGVGVL